MVNLQNTTSLNGLINQAQAGAGSSAANPASSLLGNFSTATLIIGLFAGLVGSAYFLYGKRQENFPWLFAGMALWIVPFFISSAWWLGISCGTLAFAPFVFSKYV